jgi:hypothetical protein
MRPTVLVDFGTLSRVVHGRLAYELSETNFEFLRIE